MLINATNLTNLNQGFKSLFQSALALVEPSGEPLRMRVPSATSEETYAWLGASTGFREWIGDRQYQAIKAHGYKIVNKDFENTVEVPRNTILDDQYGVFSPLFQQLGMDAKLHPDELTFNLLQAGFTTNCYDGQYFFDTDHPVGTKNINSVSNFGGGTGAAWYLLDLSKVVKPIIFQDRAGYQFVSLTRPEDPTLFNQKKFVYGVDCRANVGFGLWQCAYASRQPLTADNYAAARQAMLSLKNDAGKPLAIKPTHLWVPPNLEGQAMALLNAQKDAAGSDNVWYRTATPVVSPWLATS